MNMKTISPKLGVGCMVSFLGDSFKSLGLPFLLQETGLSKPNPKFRRILYIFGGLHPKKLKKCPIQYGRYDFSPNQFT